MKHVEQENNMVRSIIISLCVLFIASAQAGTSKSDTPKDFDNYVEGALIVYSQFVTPSKKESEEFYNFVKSKWQTTRCSNNCASLGYKAGSEYAEHKNIEIKYKK